MRFSTKQQRGGKNLVMNMTSLIDVTFLLLVYFMTPTIQTQNQSAGGSDADFQAQSVDVLLRDGVQVYQLGQQTMRTEQELRQRLSGLPLDLGVFIRAGDGVSVGFTMAAIQAARDAGFRQVTYVPLEK